MKLEVAGIKAVKKREPVSGGDISEAEKITTEEGNTYFLKQHQNAPKGLFASEANSIQRLGDAGVNVPSVIYYDDSAILLSWIEGKKTSVDGGKFADMLITLHRTAGEYYGLDHDQYIGTLPQRNERYDSWIPFFRDKRLRVQQEIALERGYLPKAREEKLQRLINQLETLLEEPEHPALLHGDLWSGNWLSDRTGSAYLIDPCAFYGDPQYDVAMMRLFGGFPAKTEQHYRQVMGEESEAAIDLYQLYFLLAHLNMFGEAYGSSVDQILNKYS